MQIHFSGKATFYTGLVEFSCLLGFLVGPYYATIMFSYGYTFSNLCNYISLAVFTLLPFILYLLQLDKPAEQDEDDQDESSTTSFFNIHYIPLAIANFVVAFSSGMKESIL